MAQAPLPMPTAAARALQIQNSVRYIERRQWWLWCSAALVALLLTIAIASFTLPGLLVHAEAFYPFSLNKAVRGLVGLVLLFNFYAIYQQLQIRRIRRQLAAQVDALGKMEARTEEVYKLAVLDPLTGLFNRRSSEQRLAEEISRAQRHGGPLTVLLLDLNGLKNVNDRLGHAAGDEFLQFFAQCLNKAIRASDLAARLGGDEFLVVLPECSGGEVRHVLERLSGLSMEWDGRAIPVNFSAGWTSYQLGESPDELLRRADEALYANKRAGKEERELNARFN